MYKQVRSPSAIRANRTDPLPALDVLNVSGDDRLGAPYTGARPGSSGPWRLTRGYSSTRR